MTKAAEATVLHEPTLRHVLEMIGPPVVQVLTGDDSLDVPVRDVVLLDPLDDVTAEPGALLLAVGIRPGAAAALDVIRQAGDAGVAGVLLKLHGEPTDRLVRVAADAGVALLSADQEVPWRQLSSLLAGAIGSAMAGVQSIESVGSGDLFALANAVAAMVGGAVSIEDPQQRVLAYSNLEDQPIDEARRQGILGRQVPDHPDGPKAYRKLWRSNGVIRAEFGGETYPRLAVAVRAGSEVLGSIWVVESSPLGTEARAALADASRLAALHLLRARTGADLERRSRSELLRSLLDGRTAADIAAARLGVDPATPAAVLGFELPSDELPEELLAERVADLVLLHCEAFRRQSSCVATGRVVYAFVPVTPGTPRARLVELATAVVGRAESALRLELRAAIGSTVPTVAETPAARREVDQVLHVLARDPRHRRVATIEDVHQQTVLLELEALLTAKPHLRLAPVTAMLEHDRAKQMPYADTVLAYLDALGDVPSAAAHMHVHPNTFRYRLRRVRELFGIELDDPDIRLVLWLQLRLLGKS